ncbi:MAG: penicillin acylase family protein, partial [Anaerolineales bacterium]|nr:penicillin acylase family protein [Anaerolineales bacterium]
YVFQPMLELDGILASTVGKIIGVGSGRGIGFLLIVTGLINLIIMFFVYAHPRIRLIEDEIPDALPDEEETDADDDGTAVSTTKNQNTTNLQSRGEDMKTAKKWGLRIGLGLIALVILLAGYIYISLRRALPQTDGTLALPGLNDEVRIERDEWGTVQIYAENEHDLFLAQGYVHAQDRFWQMEFWRHVSLGRISEIAGEAAVSNDTFIRTMGWNRMAETTTNYYKEQAPEFYAIMEAYSAGVNAYLAENPTPG